MKREREPILRPSKRQEVANMNDVLAGMQSSGSIHFLKSLPQSAIPTRKSQHGSQLALPSQFVQENGDKIKEWVTLRTQSSCGRISRPWDVRLSVFVTSPEAAKVRFTGGWNEFAAGNRLKEGDSLIFLLKEGASSEFEVHMFRGPGGSPYFPEVGDSSSNEEEEENASDEEEERSASDSENNSKQSPVPSRVHQQGEHNKAFTGNSSESKAAPLQHATYSENHCAFPGFRKQLTASSIQRCDPCHRKNSGQFEIPHSFMKTHGAHFQACVKLQGVYEDSPTYVIPCWRCKTRDDIWRLFFHTTAWSTFVKDNHLKKGQYLQFSLTADSYFVVRKV